MKSKEEFKIFVSKYPSFASHVLKEKVTWQKLYELYNLYDEDASVWDEYKKEEKVQKSASSVSLASIVNSLKGIDLDGFQSNLSNIGKAVSFLEEFTRKDPKKEEKKKNIKETGNIDRFYTD